MKFIFVLLALVAGAAAADERLELPDGFTIERLNFDVPNARQMALSANGTLIIGTRRAGKVYAVPNALTAAAPRVVTLFRGLSMPSGVAIAGDDLYIGAVERILKIANIDANLRADPAYTTVTDDLPDKSHHGWKYLKFGPDGDLYVPVGAPCNVCLSKDPRFASLLRMDPASGATRIVAHGIRNTVGFAWHPETRALWFTDNGRDMLGDDLPPEELNVLTREGEHFGYPFRHGPDIADPKFGDHEKFIGLDVTPPVLNIQAHSAALGIDFYTGDEFPDAYRHALFIAEHGSWNRSSKVGYQVSVVHLDEDGPRYAPFVTGWLDGQKSWGRPNDVLVTPDGALLISDDQQGLIYRVRYAESS